MRLEHGDAHLSCLLHPRVSLASLPPPSSQIQRPHRRLWSWWHRRLQHHQQRQSQLSHPTLELAVAAYYLGRPRCWEVRRMAPGSSFCAGSWWTYFAVTAVRVQTHITSPRRYKGVTGTVLTAQVQAPAVLQSTVVQVIMDAATRNAAYSGDSTPCTALPLPAWRDFVVLVRIPTLRHRSRVTHPSLR